jgi:hypothetical protein
LIPRRRAGWREFYLRNGAGVLRATANLEHVPKKLPDFFEENMLNIYESARFLADQMCPSGRKTR